MKMFGAILALILCPFSVFAQETQGAILYIEKGSVMTEAGGVYRTATSGTKVRIGSSVLISENAKAFIQFDQKCRQELHGPDTVVVERTCTPVAVKSAPGRDAVIIAGSAALLAAILEQGKKSSPPPPVSLGPRP